MLFYTTSAAFLALHRTTSKVAFEKTARAQYVRNI